MATAADVVKVDVSTISTTEVYTKGGTESYVQSELSNYAKASDTYTKSQTFTQGQVRKLINDLSTGDVTTNKNNITTLEGKTAGLSPDGKSLTDMDKVETGALKVTGQISDGADVTTTLAAIDASMKQTDTNKADIVNLKTTTGKQDTAIKDLQKKTTNISYDDGAGTSIDGITVKDGNIVGNGNSAITQLANVETDKIKTDSINGKSLTGTNVATEKEVKDVADAVKKETDARTEADKALDEKIAKNSQNIATLNENGVKYDTDVKDKITLKGVDGTTITRLKDAALNDSSTEAVTGKQLYKTNAELAAETKARTDKDTELEKRIATNSGDITALDGKIKTNADNIQTNANNIKINKEEIARVNGELVKTNDCFNAELGKTNDYFNKELSKTNNHFNTELGKTNAALQATNERTAGIGRINATNETTIEKNVTVDNEGNVTAKGKLKGEVVDAGAVNAGSLIVENASTLKGDVTMNQKLSVIGDTSLGKTDVGGALNVTGASDLKDNVILGTNAANTVTVNGKSDFKAAVEMDKGLTVTNGDTSLKKTDVDGALTVTGESSLKNTTVGGTLDVTGATTLKGTLTAKENATFEKNVTVQNDLTVNGKLNVDKISMKNDELKNGKKHDSATTITADEISNLAKVTDEKGNTTESQFTHNEKGTFNYAKDEKFTGEWKRATSNVTADGVENIATDSKGNNNTFTQTSTDTKNILKDKDGNTSTTRQDSKGIYGYAKDKDGNKSYTKQEGNRIAESVIGQDGKQTKSEMTSTDITNTAKDGTITSDAKDIVNKATGKISNSSATMDTTVTGKATESYGELETEVKGNEKHTVKGNQTNEVDGKQINTIKNGQENIISGGQTNTITGGQINNITGDQTTTITGNKTETVTENVTEDYKKNLTTTVGGNEIHEVKGTKTETVKGKLTENFKGGQETNVTGDQTTNVSGTQTTTATDINRNASSSMVDKVDNAYGTNTETKEAGKTTTDVSIKGTGEKGKYIRGANESGDYLIKDTLMNSETKTAEATSTEITDGTNKASTRQDAKNLAGSVTNGTEIGVSGIHANDDGSVSIDSAVAGGSMSSVINQKKDSIQSAVGDGTNSTVIHQDKDNVTIASSNGMVGLVGKDIVNNAQDTITNTAGTSITNQVNDSKVTTDANGTTFENNTPAVSDDGATTTKINGNQITTGRVNANELAVSDKDGDNTADLSVKAGEDGGVKASAGNGTTTGSLDVKADKVTTSIKSGSKENTVISTADGTSFINSEAAAPVTGASGAGTADRTTIKGNTITTGKVTMDYADVMKDLGVHGSATVDNDLTVGGITKTKTLNVTENATVGGTLDVTQKATFHDDVDIKKNLSVGGNATITGDVTAKSYKVGDKTYISAAGINANNQKITNVADGSISEGSKDAVNGGQLYGVKRDLEHQVDKVGANAAAMANLRPMEFDPSSKWNIAAAIGNYGSETAAALGAFYRPNDNVMVNLSTAFGTGENMVGGGVSVRLGKGGNKLSREETNALKAQVADLTARMDALLSVLNPNMSKDFPDVPENHWAYEAVSRLAGNDIVQGYPDGEFHGERTMTRYEMAEIIYNALSRGAEAERELVEEFKPELQAMAASEKATAERAEG